MNILAHVGIQGLPRKREEARIVDFRAIAQDLEGTHVRRSEQIHGAMPAMVTHVFLGHIERDRKQRPSQVRRLDLGLLVDRGHAAPPDRISYNSTTLAINSPVTICAIYTVIVDTDRAINARCASCGPCSLPLGRWHRRTFTATQYDAPRLTLLLLDRMRIY